MQTGQHFNFLETRLPDCHLVQCGRIFDSQTARSNCLRGRAIKLLQSTQTGWKKNAFSAQLSPWNLSSLSFSFHATFCGADSNNPFALSCCQLLRGGFFFFAVEKLPAKNAWHRETMQPATAATKGSNSGNCGVVENFWRWLKFCDRGKVWNLLFD